MTIVTGTVLRATAGFVDVDTPRGIIRCKLRGRLKQRQLATDLCVIGDRVELVVGGDDAVGVIEEVLPRRSVLSRQHPARRYREDVMVANLDQLVVVLAFGDPPLRPRLLDRFLAIAEHASLEATIVVNKAERATDEERALLSPYADLGYPLLLTSAHTGVGVDALRERLAGRLSAFAGPSGVGKSSLLNAIEPGLGLRVGAVSESTTKGRHTTRVATLHAVAGGWVADTPGIRELAAWDLPLAALDACFVELRGLRERCAFSDCRHDAEPGCAVKQAVAAGAISQARYQSYLRLRAGEER